MISKTNGQEDPHDPGADDKTAESDNEKVDDDT